MSQFFRWKKYFLKTWKQGDNLNTHNRGYHLKNIPPSFGLETENIYFYGHCSVKLLNIASVKVIKVPNTRLQSCSSRRLKQYCQESEANLNTQQSSRLSLSSSRITACTPTPGRRIIIDGSFSCKFPAWNQAYSEKI